MLPTVFLKNRVSMAFPQMALSLGKTRSSFPNRILLRPVMPPPTEPGLQLFWQYSCNIRWLWSCSISIWACWFKPAISVIENIDSVMGAECGWAKCVWSPYSVLCLNSPGLNRQRAFKHVNSVLSSLKLQSFVTTSLISFASLARLNSSRSAPQSRIKAPKREKYFI